MVRFVLKKCKHLEMPQSELDHYVKKERASIGSLRGVRAQRSLLQTLDMGYTYQRPMHHKLTYKTSHDDICLWATILQARLRPCIESHEVDVIAILKNQGALYSPFSKVITLDTFMNSVESQIILEWCLISLKNNSYQQSSSI